MNILKRIGLSVLLITVLLSTFAGSSRSQLNADGKDFYVGLLYPSFMSQNISSFGRNVQGFYGVYVLISSYYDNVVTVSYFDDAGKEGFQQTFKIAARRAIQVPLDVSRTKMTDPGEMPEYKSCHITALKAINVQYFSTGSCAGGSYLSLPTNVLGKNYVVESYHDNAGGVGGVNSNENSAGYFMVIATYDGTNVQITPNTTTAKGKPGVNSGPGSNGSQQPFLVGLNRGQCYMVKSTGSDISNDISGTTVISDKPVAVIAGHENAFTDGSDIGNIVLEARDYMIEQMLPVEYWDTTGYVSIPFIDSKQPAPGGEGDEYHVFAGTSKGASVTMNSSVQTGVVFPTGQYPSSVAAKVGIIGPVNFYSTNAGGKFHIAQYDQRMQGPGAPYPAPSQMTIIPQSRWKTSYLWYVPNNTFEILQGYFINVICRRVDYDHDSIQIAVNGGKLASIKAAGLSLKKLWSNIPDHPELVGITYAIGPGAYYATSIAKGPDLKGKTGFMIYNYGFRAIDPDRDLGDFCGDDHFFAYALPIGFLGGTGDTTKLTVTVDTLCAKWNVCVHVRGKNAPGIKQLTILDDPNGDIVRPGRKFYNVQFDPAIDPDDTREINLTGNDSDYCIQVNVKNPLDTGYCPLYIVDNTGNDYLVELRYKSPKLKEVISPSTFPNGFDTILYPPTAVGDQVCATIYYINNGDSAKGDPNIPIKKISLKKNNGNFTITDIKPALPTSLNPKSKNRPFGDTLAVTVCFNSKDTALHLDTLIFENDCFKAPVTLIGPGGTPLIYATDHDYGSVILGESKCDTISVKNIGNLPFTLTDKWVLHNVTDFAMTPGSAARLPKVLKPGDTIQLRFCFSPSVVGPDSTTSDWVTDIGKPYDNQIKSWSYLKGIGIRPGVIWDRPTQVDSTICDSAIVTRVYLLNRQTAKTYVNKVYFDGPDAAEYKITGNQSGYNPFERFEMQPNDSIWMEYTFTPDINKPNPYADRHVQLKANFNRNVSGTIVDSTIIDITGLVRYPRLTANPYLIDNPVNGIGVLQTGYTTLIDSGNAPFVIESISFIPPVKDVLDGSATQIKPGDIIYPGQIFNVQVDAQLDYAGDTVVPVIFYGKGNCAKPITIMVHIVAAKTDLQGTGWPAPQTFTCRNASSTVKATNRSTGDWLLKEVAILSTGLYPNAGEFDLVDVKNGGAFTKTLAVNTVIAKNGSLTFPVQYHPSIRGNVSAQVRYIWDSASLGKVFDTVTNVLTGTGLQVHTVLTAAESNGSFYTETTANQVHVPIRFTQDTLVANADVRRVTFDIQYRDDLFHFNGITPANGYTLNNPGTLPTVSGGMATLPVNISSAAPIANVNEVIKLDLQVMVANVATSQFTLSNVKFYDGADQFICYATADTIPGDFVPLSLCGDSTLRDYMKGKLPTRIVSVSPSVVTDGNDPVLTYQVGQSGVQVKVEVFNVLGQKISTPRYMNTSTIGEHNLPISILGMKSGTYTVRLSTPTSTQTAQFVLNK